MLKRIKDFRVGWKWSPPQKDGRKPEPLCLENGDFQPNVNNLEHPETRGAYLFPVSQKVVGGSKWGYINPKGNIRLPLIYEYAGDFQDNGLAIVRLHKLSGVIDGNGYFIVKPKYEQIHPFSEGRAAVLNGADYKVIDESGKEITEKAYSFIGDYQEGRAVFADKDEEGNCSYGYLNRRGREVIPAVYESASDFQNGRAVVKIKGEGYALISLTGKVLYRYPYAFVSACGEGLLAFQKQPGGLFGYINEAGKIVIPPKFSTALAFSGERAVVSMTNGNQDYFGLIDREGRFILKPYYHRLLDLGEERVAIGKAANPEKTFSAGKFALGDKNGRMLTGFIYNGVTPFEMGRASAYDDHSTFFIDRTGKKLSSLPRVNGCGMLCAAQTLYRGKIDFRILYFDKKGEQVWRSNPVIALKPPFAVKEKKYKPNKDFLVYYPEITGIRFPEIQAKVNQYLKDLAGIKETPPHLQLETNYLGDFELPFFQNRLLVIEITGRDYWCGAVGGSPVKKYAHIDLESGEIFQLKDLFKPGSRYVRVISELIGNQLKKNRNNIPEKYKGIRSDQPFFISAEGLNMVFAPHELFPGAEDFFTLTISFQELSSIIDNRGAFWKSFHCDGSS